MKIPFFDLRRLYLEQKEVLDRAIEQVLDGGQYILGQFCQDFEDSLKEYLVHKDCGFVMSCNSGTDALVLSLLASGIGPGHEVVTVSHTAIPTVAAIREVGATPTFVDIDPNTWLMEVQELEAVMGSRTKAIIPVHLYGNMVPIPEIQSLLKKLGREDISIIEDVAQAQGASYQGRQAGTFGRFGAFSFYPTKNLGAFGDGGAVFCNSLKDAALIRMLRNYGRKDRYLAEVPRGINSRLDVLQAAVLSIRLKKVTEWNQKKSMMMEQYRNELKVLPIHFQQVSLTCQPAWHLCVVSLESEIIRNRLMEHLAQNGIETFIHYPTPTHRQEALAYRSKTDLPVTQNLARKILTLPLNPCLNGVEQEYIIRVIRSFFG